MNFLLFKRSASLVSIFSLLTLTPSLAADQSVVIPSGILIETHLDQDMSSGTVHTGDLFQFVVGKDVVVNGMTVIPIGSKGVGHVTEAHSAGGHGKSGGIRLAYDYVFAVEGTQIPVAHNKEASEQDKSTALALGIGILTFGIGGLFAHNLVHGHDVTIPESAVTYVATLANKAVVVDSVKNKAPIVSSNKSSSSSVAPTVSSSTPHPSPTNTPFDWNQKF